MVTIGYNFFAANIQISVTHIQCSLYMYIIDNIIDLALVSFILIITEALRDRCITSYHFVPFITL